MNVLIVGSDTKGAWEMRGRQLGAAIGARVTTEPGIGDWIWAERVVLVKHAATTWAEKARVLSVPVIWDVLDVWAQPEENAHEGLSHVGKVREIQQLCGARTLIGATRAMADAIGGVYLTHHCRIGLEPTAPRAKAEVIGYDGQKKYLGQWLRSMERACDALGLRFVVNPADLSTVDVLVSLRDGRWDGWVCRQWKSGVKYVNAIVAGRPIITQASAACSELQPIGAEVEIPEDLVGAIQHAIDPELRELAYQKGLGRHEEFQLPAVASQYLELLRAA